MTGDDRRKAALDALGISDDGSQDDRAVTSVGESRREAALAALQPQLTTNTQSSTSDSSPADKSAEREERGRADRQRSDLVSEAQQGREAAIRSSLDATRADSVAGAAVGAAAGVMQRNAPLGAPMVTRKTNSASGGNVDAIAGSVNQYVDVNYKQRKDSGMDQNLAVYYSLREAQQAYDKLSAEHDELQKQMNAAKAKAMTGIFAGEFAYMYEAERAVGEAELSRLKEKEQNLLRNMQSAEQAISALRTQKNQSLASANTLQRQLDSAQEELEHAQLYGTEGDIEKAQEKYDSISQNLQVSKNAEGKLKAAAEAGDGTAENAWSAAHADKDEMQQLVQTIEQLELKLDGHLTEEDIAELNEAYSRYNEIMATFVTPPQIYSEYNIRDWANRAYYLSVMPADEWTDAERAEAEAIVNALKGKYILDTQEGAFANRETVGNSDAVFVENIYNNLTNRLHPGGTAFMTGFLRGIGAISASQAAAEIFLKNEPSVKPLSDELFQFYLQNEAFAKEKAGAAYGTGNLSGSITAMQGIGAASKGVWAATKIPALARAIASGATTFAAFTGVQEAGSFATGDIGAGRFFTDVGVSALAGAGGAAASVGSRVLNASILKNLGLAKNSIANAVAAGLSGASFAGGDSAVRTIAGYLEYGSDYEIDGDELLRSALIALAFGTVEYYLSGQSATGNTNSAAKAEPSSEFFNKNMSPEEMKQAYRKYAKQYHPDTHPGDAAAAEAMARINAEYEAWLAYTGAHAQADINRAKSAGDTEAASAAEQTMREAVNELVVLLGEDAGSLTPEAADALQILESIAGQGAEPSAAVQGAVAGGMIPEPKPTVKTTDGGIIPAEAGALEDTGYYESRLDEKAKPEAITPEVEAQQVTETPTVSEQKATEPQFTPQQPSVKTQEKSGEPVAWKPGTVSSEGVPMSELRKKFNDVQNTSYRLLTRYAEVSGIDIVLYASQPDKNGEYPSDQGRFQWKDDKIYIDVNAGLLDSNDINDFGKYVMMRTFGHEFSHFIEKWNRDGYNGFSKVLFDTLKARGQNVDELVKDMQAADKSGKMTPEQARREVLAEAMSDVLPESSFAQRLAKEHPNVFKRLLNKLRDFSARLKQLYRRISGTSPREARIVKENGKYIDGLVDMYDKIAKEAIENYQRASGATEVDNKVVVSESKKETVKPAPKKEPPKRDEQKQPEKPKKGSADAFLRGDIYNEKKVKEAAENKAAREIIEKMPMAESPALVEEAKPSAAAEKPAEKAKQESAVKHSPEGETLKKQLDGLNSVDMNGFRYDIIGMKSKTVDMQTGRVTDGQEYRASIKQISKGGVPVENARSLFDRTFDSREEAADYMVSVAENNNLLKGAPDNGQRESKAPDVRGKTGDRSDGRGTVPVPVQLQEGRVPGEAAGRQPDSVSSEDGRGAGRDGDSVDAERNGRSGSEGAGESGVQRGHAELTPEEHKEQAEETHAAVEHDVAEKSTVKEGGDNFRIGESLELPAGKKARYKANVEAIRLVKQLEADGRIATPAEQEILSKYVGWGGISEAFDEKKSEWSKEYAELKEVLTDDEYSAARGSTLNAHYTSIPVIRAMYAGLDRLGFQGGRMLEPSSGVGNFVGAMPAAMSDKVRSWTMVELDKITGQIASQLYPQADVRIEGFETAIIPDSYMDVAIGNVPFGNYAVTDRAYPKKLTSAIHNYFFAKSLDKVRPGGIVMFITSSYTMNSQDATVRRYIAKQADLLGAIRLPNNAFSGNAGTEVVTDILVLKKRAPGTPYSGVPFESADYTWNLSTYQNEYFSEHPEMVLGEQVKDRNGMYSRDSYTVKPFTDRGTLEEQIGKAFESIDGKMDYPAKKTPEKTNYAVERAEKGTKQGGYVNKDGKLYQNDSGELKEVQTDEKTAKRITGMLQIRDLARNLMNAQMQGQTDQSINDARMQLNKAYDAFVKENGYLNSPANKRAFFDDPDKFSLFALENWDNEKKTATKADIFKENTVRPNRTVTHVDSVADGLTVSRNTTGGIDVPLISRLTGQSETDVTRELIESEAAFKDRDGNLLPAEIYLSGNVRAKLREAQGLVPLDKDYQHNVDALKQIVPKDVPHEAIFVQPGAPWIPDTVYSDFAAYILGGNNHRSYGGPDIYIHRSNETGNFTVEVKNARLKANYLNNQKWGTPQRSFLNLLDAMLNSRSVTVSRKDADGKSYVDTVATAAANAKVDEIKAEFQRWLWEDENRTKDLEYLYNETFNALVTPKYDGSKLTVNGLRAGWSLKAHQADAVQRVVSSGGNTLLAHRVGAGKTMEMAAAAMKLKELGIVKKPMFAVPKSLVAQWGKEFMSYFPTAKLLVAEQGDFTPANRKTFANRIATGNYDAVIVSYEQFEKIPMSDSYTLSMYQDQINEILMAIEEAKAETGQKSMSVKDLEKKRKQLQTKIDKLTDKPKDADSIEFEQLGIDSIFVDEAHNFKNLWYTTSMNNVAGLGNKDGSKRAYDLYTKVRYLQQLNGGRGVVFATATPVMNSMSEMYIMQKYLQPELLKQLGLSTFDAWAKQFGEVVNAVEIKPSGQGFRVKQKFSRFKNVGELQLLFRNFADVMTKIPDLKIPKMKGGEVRIIESEPGEFQQNYMKELQKRADNIKNVDPSEDNMLKITSDGRKISYTQRMIDPSLPYEEGCKIYKCADNVVEEYKASKAIKGTQLIFLDMATPKGKTNSEKAAQEEESIDTESARLYDDLKARLVKKGIPAKEIAFIHDADTDAKKSKLFGDVNDGKVRVLIGSTGKMGVGMNAQKRIVAIHHLDAPWRPGDVEQRDGRAFRQKNINDEVSKYVYVTKGSFDARLWDILGFKQNFIDQIMNGENVGREVEDTGEVTLSASEIKALASGNPMIKEQVELDVDIKRLENLYMAHQAAKVEARSKLAKAKQQKAEIEKRIDNAKKDLKNRGAGYEDESFSMTVGKRTLTDKKAAGEALMNATAKANKDNYTKIGSFAGFDILAIETNEGFKGLLKGAQGYAFNFYPDQTTRMVTRLQSIVKDLGGYIEQQEKVLADTEKEIKGQEALMQQPFAQQQELDRKRARYNEIMDVLNPKEEQAISDTEDEERVEYSLRREREPEIKKAEPRIKQEFSSAATSLNQVAALFKSKYFMPGDYNIDIGGGAFNATTEYLYNQYGTENLVFDPYNRGTEENLATLNFLRAGNRADTATCANVLNVIKEKESRANVILEVAKSIKEDGTAYFSVYEKDKSGEGRQTGADQWQNSRATADYVSEIEEFFDSVERKGGVIIATDPKSELPKAFWRITEEQEIEYARRRNSLSNREVLTLAADEINTDKLTDAEKNALDLFRTRLDRLEEAEDKRAELGRQYKQQQFTKGGSREEAEKIRNRMKVYDERIQRLSNELLDLENKDVLRNVLDEARSIVENEEQKHGADMVKRYRERRNESAAARKYRERVKQEVETLRKWLVNPSNKDVRKHVPAEIQKSVADFLDSINLMSKRALKSGGLDTTKADERYLKNMRKLRDAIKENVDSRGLYSGYADLPPDFLDNFEAMIRKAEQHIDSNPGVFVVNQMSSGELKELSQALRTLKKYITTMNLLHRNAMFAHVDEAGDDTTQHLSKFKTSTKSGTVYQFMRFGYMRPSYAFEHFGEGGKSIEHEFREGQATQAFLAKKVIDFAKKTYTAKEVKEWSEEVKTFKLADGTEISLPVTHLMSLYCLNKRAQAKTHIYGDGVRVANYKADGKVQLDDGHLLSVEDVQDMTKALTPRQREVADELQKYMSTECADWGNYVSMARFDVQQFGEDNYFPINSDGRYLPATADESPDNAGLYALLNMGFTKELKENAKNRIILYNIFDVFANHTASMTQYRSFALPVLDALKWFNYRNENTSVRDQLARAFGAPEESRAGSGSKGYAESFVLNLIRAYNGTSAQGDQYDTGWLKALHRYNGAAIAYNMRVVVQQPLSITRAAMILNPNKLRQGLGMSVTHLRKLAEEMESHSGIALWKQFGFYDTNISRGLTELIKQNPEFLDRVMEIGTIGAQAADRLTWAAMWYAAKETVDRGNYTTEEAYYKAVTELFEDVIYKTQVVDSVLTKSEMLRSKSPMTRHLASFMSEPSTTVSMVMDAYYKYTDDRQSGSSRSEAWKKNGENIRKTIAVYAIGQILLAAAQSIVDAWRDDDEYDPNNWFNNYMQKYLHALKGNVIEELLPFGKIPLVSEVYELLKSRLDKLGVFDKLGLDLYGNDISSGLSMYTKYLTKAMDIVTDRIISKSSNYTDYGLAYNLLRAASNLFGMPVATATREIVDIWNNTVGYMVPRMKLETYESAMDRKYKLYVRQTGLGQKAMEKIFADADTSGNGCLTQDELGTVLQKKIESGEITEEQADALWIAGGNDWAKSFSEWDQHVKQITESTGLTMQEYNFILDYADTDNKGVTQEELGPVLTEYINSGEISKEQADAIWKTKWNQPKSKTFDDWLDKQKQNS